MRNEEIVLLFCACANAAEAKRIARALVRARLAACVNVHSRVHSVYRWRGALEEAAEAVIVVKTTAARRAAAEAKIAELHSYELPSIVRVRASANSRVTKWFKDCVE